MPVPESGIRPRRATPRRGHPVRRRAGQEPLRRPHVHPAVPDAARAGRASSSTRCARTSAASGWSSSTTRSCAARRRSQIVALLREAGAAEVHFRIIAPPLPAGRASTASTPPTRSELHRRRPIGRARSASTSASTRSGYLSLDGLVAATGCRAERFCIACFDGDYPVPVPYDARPQVRAGGRDRLRGCADGRDAAAYRRRRRRHRGRREGRRADRGHVASTLRPEVVGDIGGSAGSPGSSAIGDATGARLGDRRRRHEVEIARRSAATTRSASTSSRCASTTSCAGRRAARSSSTTSPSGAVDPRARGRARRGRRRGVPPGGLRAGRRRDGGASRR